MGGRSLDSISHLLSCPVLPLFLNHCLKDYTFMFVLIQWRIMRLQKQESKMLGVPMTGPCASTRSISKTKRCALNELSWAACEGGRVYFFFGVKCSEKLLSTCLSEWELTAFIKARLNQVLNVPKSDALVSFQRDHLSIIQMSTKKNCHKRTPGECPHLRQPSPLSSGAWAGKAIFPFSHESWWGCTLLLALPPDES